MLFNIMILYLFVLNPYSRVHISSDSLFSKILKEPSIVKKKNDTSYENQGFCHWKKPKPKFFLKKKNSKWPTKKKLIFQLRQFSIFFVDNFMDWSLG